MAESELATPPSEAARERSSLAPIVKRSTEDRALDSLRDHIMAGGLRAGTRLTEHALSETLAISRATVRTALHRLAVEGLVVQVPYTGWQVVDLTPQDIWELYTLRAPLEALAARLLAERLDEAKRARLQAAYDQLIAHCEARDRHRIAESDFALHALIVELAGHHRLLAQYRLVEQQIRFFVASSDALATDPAEIITQHAPLVQALFDGDAAAAAAAAEAHSTTEGRKLEAFVREGRGATP